MVATFDACVLAKLYLDEPESAFAQHVAARFRTVNTPDLARLEVASAVTRAARTGALTGTQALERLDH